MKETRGITIERFRDEVRRGEREYPDDRLLDDYERIVAGYNALSAASTFLAAAAFAGAQRPHLTPILLLEPLKLLFMCGYRTAGAVLGFVEYNLGLEDKWLYRDAGPEGRAWLRDHLPARERFIQKTLECFLDFADPLRDDDSD